VTLVQVDPDDAITGCEVLDLMERDSPHGRSAPVPSATVASSAGTGRERCASPASAGPGLHLLADRMEQIENAEAFCNGVAELERRRASRCRPCY
jgi:hypothetical protein